MSKEEKDALVGRTEASNLCGFEGAKDTLCRSLELQAEAGEGSQEAVRLPTDVRRKAEARVMERTAFRAAARGRSPAPFR